MAFFPRCLALGSAALLLAAASAWAGRPQLVDDAGTNDAGHGHVESWFERAPDGGRVWTVAPAYAPIARLELTATLARDVHAHHNQSRWQAKWQFTAPVENRCHHAAVLGAAHEQHRAGWAPWLTGIMSCPLAGAGLLHLNLGAMRPPGGPGAPFAGVAWERQLGMVTGHLEWLVARGAKPVFNLGLRREIGAGLQLDGSIGRSGGQTLWSLGLKQQF